jgi:tungstate transport system permease protein
VGEFGLAFRQGFALVVSGDAEFYGIVALSLRVSLTATALAFALGAPLGALLSATRFPGRRAVLVAANALLGLPPVVVGLAVYMLVSRQGPLGALGWLFTPAAMILAQTVLTLPIVVALTVRAADPLWRDYGEALMIDGASKLVAIAQLLAMARPALVTVFLAAFGRAIAEVGAIIMVGGNIRGATRTMTTAIALETSRGELALALGLGFVLLSITFAVSALAFLAERRSA